MADRPEISDRRVVLLGPQHETKSVARAVDDLGVAGPLATVTAGWEEREGEDAELSSDLNGRTRNLELFPRAEDVFLEDEGVRALLHERFDRMRDLRDLYHLRLAPQLQACRELLARTDPAAPDALHGPEIDGAIEGVRLLDEHHLGRIAALEAEITERLAASERPAIQRHRQDLAGVLEDVGAILIAGGHVGILLSRLRLFDVASLAPTKPIIAWSGGAIVLAQRMVLFHDSPPQGPGHPEVYAPGLGLVGGVVPLPHARHRLLLDDPARVALFARRFAPDLCATLDSGARLDCGGEIPGWQVSGSARLLQTDGRMTEEAA